MKDECKKCVGWLFLESSGWGDIESCTCKCESKKIMFARITGKNGTSVSYHGPKKHFLPATMVKLLCAKDGEWIECEYSQGYTITRKGKENRALNPKSPNFMKDFEDYHKRQSDIAALVRCAENAKVVIEGVHDTVPTPVFIKNTYEWLVKALKPFRGEKPTGAPTQRDWVKSLSAEGNKLRGDIAELMADNLNLAATVAKMKEDAQCMKYHAKLFSSKCEENKELKAENDSVEGKNLQAAKIIRKLRDELDAAKEKYGLALAEAHDKILGSLDVLTERMNA